MTNYLCKGYAQTYRDMPCIILTVAATSTSHAAHLFTRHVSQSGITVLHTAIRKTLNP